MNSDDRSTVHDDDTTSATAMTASTTGSTTMPAFDDELRLLVRFAAVITVGSEAELRRAAASVVGVAHPEWVEEVVLQSYLFAGFPRALNAAREWRRLSGRAAPASDERSRIDHVAQWQRDGEATCATVYGRFYERLRVNIRDLHPALDAWMIVDGYGKVLSRPKMDLMRRELCIVAACAAARQDRQLHSHLHGALNAGATPAQLAAVLDAVTDMVPQDDMQRFRHLFERVRGK
jgi:4-carboxymuconolactone decarboxylase